MKNRTLLRLTYSAVCLAAALVLPLVTGGVPKIGNMLCPMHIPVILCGFICGWQWGLIVGAIAPLFRSLTLGAPVLFPIAVCMSVELAVYGAVSGALYRAFPKKKGYIYLSLICAMICGRIAWGAFRFALSGFNSTSFGLAAFISGAVTAALPGIVIQILLIPIIVMLIQNRSYNKK